MFQFTRMPAQEDTHVSPHGQRSSSLRQMELQLLDVCYMVGRGTYLQRVHQLHVNLLWGICLWSGLLPCLFYVLRFCRMLWEKPCAWFSICIPAQWWRLAWSAIPSWCWTKCVSNSHVTHVQFVGLRTSNLNYVLASQRYYNVHVADLLKNRPWTCVTFGCLQIIAVASLHVYRLRCCLTTLCINSLSDCMACFSIAAVT